jgi:transcriptional regulator with XRE-family HTH domain
MRLEPLHQLARFRRERGISRVELTRRVLARGVRCRERLIQHLEAGRTPADAAVVEAIAAALGVTPEVLMAERLAMTSICGTLIVETGCTNQECE